MLRTILLTLVIAAASASANEFSAKVQKTSSTDLIQVDGSYRKDLPSRLKVSLRSKEEIAGKDLYLNAYFYDENGTLLRTQKGPNAIWTQTKKGFESVKFPETLKGGNLEAVYLALPESVKKMKTVIVVFGSGDQLTAEVYPNTKSVEAFEFPEKAKVAKK